MQAASLMRFIDIEIGGALEPAPAIGAFDRCRLGERQVNPWMPQCFWHTRSGTVAGSLKGIDMNDIFCLHAISIARLLAGEKRAYEIHFFSPVFADVPARVGG